MGVLNRLEVLKNKVWKDPNATKNKFEDEKYTFVWTIKENGIASGRRKQFRNFKHFCFRRRKNQKKKKKEKKEKKGKKKKKKKKKKKRGGVESLPSPWENLIIPMRSVVCTQEFVSGAVHSAYFF